MRNLIRENELQELYDRLIAREHLLLLGKVGSGKSYLLDKLKERLEDRRTIFIIDCRQLVSFEQFARVLPAAVKNEAQSNPNLLYQFQRFEDEHPLQELRNWQDLEAYIKDLGVFLTQAGGDYLFYLKNWEEWELEWPQVEFLSVLEDLAQARNIQILISTIHLTESLSRTAWPPYRLAILEPHQVWEQAGAAEERAFAFAQGNLSILKALSSERDYKPQVLLDNHHPTFSLLRKRLTDLQWRLLKAIALHERVAQPHAFEFLVANKLGAASSVERALRNLLQTDLIVKEEEDYRLSNTLLMRWIQSLYGSEKALT